MSGLPSGRAASFRDYQPPAGFSGAVLVAEDAQVLLVDAYGYADAAARIRNTADTIFRIGSLSKVITAAAVLRLADRGLVDLHLPLDQSWPDWPKPWGTVTPHQLLAHQAGIPDFTREPDFPAGWEPRVDAARLIAKLGGSTAQRTQVSSYSNSHYILLGELVARSQRLGYLEFVRTELLQPAGIIHTDLAAPAASPANRAVGYMEAIDSWTPADSLPSELSGAAGGFSSTVGDLLQLVRALENPDGLLSARSRELMWSVHGGNFGYGWVKAVIHGEVAWIVNGNVRGFTAVMLRVPIVNCFVVVLSNRENAPVLDMAANLAGRALAP